MLIEAPKRMRIVIDGHLCIDSNILEGGGIFIGSGGPAMFMGITLRQFPDCDPTVIAPYGPDFQQYLEGINIYPSSPNRAATLIYENNSVSGRRTQRALNRDWAFPVSLDSTIINMLNNTDIVIAAPLLPNYPVSRFSQIADYTLRTQALKVLLPQGYFRSFDEQDRVVAREFDESWEILPNLDVVIVSEEDHPDMLTLAKQWSNQNRNLISIVTLGEKGALAFNNGSEIRVPTVPVPRAEIVDSVGCGEVFGAAFALVYRMSKDIRRAMNAANKVAGARLLCLADDIKIDLEAIIP